MSCSATAGYITRRHNVDQRTHCPVTEYTEPSRMSRNVNITKHAVSRNITTVNLGLSEVLSQLTVRSNPAGPVSNPKTNGTHHKMAAAAAFGDRRRLDLVRRERLQMAVVDSDGRSRCRPSAAVSSARKMTATRRDIGGVDSQAKGSTGPAPALPAPGIGYFYSSAADVGNNRCPTRRRRADATPARSPGAHINRPQSGRRQCGPADFVTAYKKIAGRAGYVSGATLMARRGRRADDCP